MTTLAGLLKLLSALGAAWVAFQAWQRREQATTTDQVDTEADQAATDAEHAQSPADFQKAAQEMSDAIQKS